MNKKISILLTEAQLQQIKDAGILDEPKSGYFEPKEGEEYWSVATIGMSQFIWDSMPIDKELLEYGIVFRTRKEAEDYNNKRIARTAIAKWRAENGIEDVDWSDKEQSKYGIFFYHKYREFSVVYCINDQKNHDNIVHFTNQPDAKRCIKECEEHLKTLWGVKE
jgi:hypothetical protein